MNTTGDMNRIVVANSAGSGNSGLVALTIPPALKMKPPALTMDKGTQWIGQIRTELRQMGVPFNLSTGPIDIFWRRLWWEYMAPAMYATGCVHWHSFDHATVHVSHAPQWVFHAAVIAMHELGHLHTDSWESRKSMWVAPKKWAREFKQNNEILAWQWAKQKMGGDWGQEAERIALHCLSSYGVHRVEV